MSIVEDRYSKIDQEDLQKKVEIWKADRLISLFRETKETQ